MKILKTGLMAIVAVMALAVFSAPEISQGAGDYYAYSGHEITNVPESDDTFLSWISDWYAYDGRSAGEAVDTSMCVDSESFKSTDRYAWDGFREQVEPTVVCSAGEIHEGLGMMEHGHTHMMAADDGSDDTVYTCPMHPEVTSDEAGKCPKCGMDLESKEGKDS